MHLQIKVKRGRQAWVGVADLLDRLLAACEEGNFSLAGIHVDSADESVRIVPVGADRPETVGIHHEIIDELIEHLVDARYGFEAERKSAEIKDIPHEPGALRRLLAEFTDPIESILVMARLAADSATVSVGLDRPVPPPSPDPEP